MAEFFGIDIKGIVHDTLTGQVQRGTLIRLVNRPPIPDRRDQPMQIERRYPFEGFVGEAKQDTFGTGAAMTARMVTILGGSIQTEPMSNDRLEIGGWVYSVKQVKMDFVGATYDCLVG